MKAWCHNSRPDHTANPDSRSGTIDRDEFVVLARELLSDTVADADTLFDQIDVDHSNDLTIEEVSDWFMNRMAGGDDADGMMEGAEAESSRGPSGENKPQL
mmetsp:Transcript_23769/g.63983  ORF Transcript_23769/g.63983 Transcript_23769/m.63983 type:complete len:101 (-) Transcript_23769:188-490(-)